jgi:NAD(P)-dependent dehydrogenase (short-subunit alcohol dehydrogenase family)
VSGTSAPAGRGRLDGKIGVVVGAGQTPGSTIGNGRAASLLFAREGARVLLVDRDLASAEETTAMIEAEGGTAACRRGDWTDAGQCRDYVADCVDRWGRLDFLHNNVGIGTGDAGPGSLPEAVFDRIVDVNLKGCLFSCQAALPVMRAQQSGSIVNISSIAAVASTPLTAYKISKIGMNALGQSLAAAYAKHGIRVNTVMPGLMDTPMAIHGAAEASGLDEEEVRARRDRQVPLRGKMGTAWDVAYASLFLHSDEAAFITGVALPVDGGQIARIG